MRFTKILLLAFSITIFSCSDNDDTVVNTENSNELKSGGLTKSELGFLTSEFVVINTSPEFLNMRAKSKAFAVMMNNNIDAKWKSRSDIAKWLDLNLSLTKFNTKQEGLNMFDSLTLLSKNFYMANQGFFSMLPRATDPQLLIIFQPIDPQLPAQPSSACMDDCVAWGNFIMDSAFSGYLYQLGHVDSMYPTSDGRAGAIAQLDASLESSLNNAIAISNSCMESCAD